MLCPICNGFEQLEARCPTCSATMADYGRADDFTGPYAPYQPNAFPDTTNMETINSELVSELSCRHVIYCPNCEITYEATITNWH